VFAVIIWASLLVDGLCGLSEFHGAERALHGAPRDLPQIVKGPRQMKKKLPIEVEMLLMRVTALEKAVKGAGIKLPPTPMDLLHQSEEEGRKRIEAAKRGE
jgi:hypothetical protein